MGSEINQNSNQAQATDCVIQVEGVRHVYKGGTVALDGIDLTIGTGLFGLLGPNGAGKSTLMRIICTLLVPTDGRILVGGRDVVKQRRSVRQLFGYLPQEFGAWRLHRVEEVVDTLARISGMKNKDRRRQRVEQVLDSVGLLGVADRKVKKLSGGMVRRLGVAQALVHEPQLLVVDEPTVGLDPEERLRFRQLMVKLGQERVIVLSTHIVADLGAGCDDLALIDHGRVVFRGSPTELLGQAKNRVFELTVPQEAEHGLSSEYEIVSRVPSNGQVKLRAVAGDGQAPKGAELMSDVTLEESYLAFMAARGRAEAALEEEEAVAS